MARRSPPLWRTADTTAAQRIQDLQQVHQARVSQLTRTAVALKAQYGANDSGVKAAEANLATATLTAARIGMAQRQAATNDLQVCEVVGAARPRLRCTASADVRLHGFLVGASKTYQQQYGFAYADAGGYFLLNYAGSDAAAQDKSAKAAPAPDMFVEVAKRESRAALF